MTENVALPNWRDGVAGYSAPLAARVPRVQAAVTAAPEAVKTAVADILARYLWSDERGNSRLLDAMAATVYRVTRNQGDLDDIRQDAYLYLAGRPEVVLERHAQGTLGYYILNYCRSKAISLKRKAKQVPVQATDAIDMPEFNTLLIRQAFKACPARLRPVLTKIAAGYDVAHAASECGVPRRTVYADMAALRTALGATGGRLLPRRVRPVGSGKTHGRYRASTLYVVLALRSLAIAGGFDTLIGEL